MPDNVPVVKELTVTRAILIGLDSIVYVQLTELATFETASQVTVEIIVYSSLISSVHVNGKSIISLPSEGMEFLGVKVKEYLDLVRTEWLLAEMEQEVKVP